MLKRPFNGSPTVDGYYTTFDSSEVHRIESTDEGGGGGSSDFSTATVTLINGASASRCVIIPTAIEASLPFEPSPFVSCYSSLTPNETVEVTAVLYKGTCKVKSGESGDQLNATTVATTFAVTSGSAELVTGDVIITGDCTITIS